MRFLALTLMSLVLYLAIVPCSDEIGVDPPNSDIAELIQAVENSAEQSHQENQCSPFCVCNCSQTRNFVPYISFQTELAVNINRNQPIPYMEFNPDGIIDSIWRPPQLTLKLLISA